VCELGWELLGVFGLSLCLLAFARWQKHYWMREQDNSEEGGTE
jgi:hypothetical protein